MSLSTSLPDFKSRALAALNAGQSVRTSNAQAFYDGGQGAYGFATPLRNWAVFDERTGRKTYHESAALAVACLATL